ncbi:type IV pilus biogenesis protein PilM [Pseudomonas chlororaphis]|uniref:type IV pilus biogenesis protein PilM n=1 Tax=Pseudomonas chlororaphis TaxID=587753 RepID=UPI002D77DE1B|nr:type IV pilus biogenesis protein PilM [Pseudomonas chlororaphis]
MPLLWLFFAILLTSQALFNTHQAGITQAMTDAEISATAGSILVYRNFVAMYAESNPAFVGSAGDVQMSIPSWYIRPPGLNNYIVTGRSYVYYTTMLPGLVGSLAAKTESTTVGTNVGGVLNSPNTGNTGIVLPAQVPVAATVIVQ